MLGTNISLTKQGSAIVTESWNGRSMLKRLVQETSGRIDCKSRLGEVCLTGRPKVKQHNSGIATGSVS